MAMVVDATISEAAPAAASDDEQDASSGDPDELTGGSDTGNADVQRAKDAGIGLDSEHWIMRSPTSKEPVIIKRSDVGDEGPTEAVLTGGFLIGPALLVGLTVIHKRKFIRVSKDNVVLCNFLTGKHRRVNPLKTVSIFIRMKERMQLRRRELTMAAEEVMLEAQTDAQKAVAKKRGKAVVASGKRLHHAGGCSSMVPDYGVVDMDVDTLKWSPTVLLRAGVTNVFMEVTAANFQALFDIVQRQLFDTIEGAALCRKGRKRRVSSAADPTAPIPSPRGTRYWIEQRGGWNHCIKEEASGGSSSGHTKRRLVRHLTSSGAAQKSRNNKRHRKATDEVLIGSDDECESANMRASSPSGER